MAFFHVDESLRLKTAGQFGCNQHRGAAKAINTVLRRAAISGTVKVEPYDETPDYFADVTTGPNTSTQTVLLDRNSYASLKNRGMRCKIDQAE